MLKAFAKLFGSDQPKKGEGQPLLAAATVDFTAVGAGEPLPRPSSPTVINDTDSKQSSSRSSSPSRSSSSTSHAYTSAQSVFRVDPLTETVAHYLERLLAKKNLAVAEAKKSAVDAAKLNQCAQRYQERYDVLIEYVHNNIVKLTDLYVDAEIAIDTYNSQPLLQNEPASSASSSSPTSSNG